MIKRKQKLSQMKCLDFLSLSTNEIEILGKIFNSGQKSCPLKGASAF